MIRIDLLVADSTDKNPNAQPAPQRQIKSPAQDAGLIALNALVLHRVVPRETLRRFCSETHLDP